MHGSGRDCPRYFQNQGPLGQVGGHLGHKSQPDLHKLNIGATFWSQVGPSWAKGAWLSQVEAKLGSSWGQVGPKLDQVGSKLGQVGKSWGQIGASWGQSGSKMTFEMTSKAIFTIH